MSRPRAYFVTDLTVSGSEPVRVDVASRGDGTYLVTVGEEQLTVDSLALPHGAVSMIVDGQSHSVEFDDQADVVQVLLRGHLSRFDVVDERRALQRASGVAAPPGKSTITAPMPGKVVRVLVKVGDPVSPGQGVVVVEAMKMENELRATAGGTVSQVHAVEGSAVETGAPLIVVE